MKPALLQKNTEIFKTALNSLSDGLVISDLSGQFLLFNPAAEKILGVGARSLNPSEWADAYGCFLPDKVTPFPADRLPLIRALQGEKIDDELIYIKNPEQPSGKWISVSGKPLMDEKRAVCGGMVIFRDISERKITEESLYTTSLRLSALTENQQSGILIENEKRIILLVNQAFCDMFGIPLPLSELVGSDCSGYAEQAKNMFVNPDEFTARIRELLQQKSMVTNDELFLTDGRVFQRDYIPIFTENEYRGHLWQYRDITERRRAQERIHTFERLSAALQQTADSVVITNKKGIIEYVNQAFEITTGFSRSEALGRTPAILKSGKQDEQFYGNLWKEIMAGRPFRCTIINRKKTGELYWAQQTITPMKDDNGNITHFVSVLKDITDFIEKKEQEAKLLVAREVQQRFYEANASLPGYDIAGAAYPADETGGDYFDFIEMKDGRLGIVVGDVSGHGIGAALMMAETRAYLRSFTSGCDDVAEIMSLVNKSLKPDLDDGQYVTLLLCCLDPHRQTLSYASAGHVPGFLLNEEGEVDLTLGGTGYPLGLFSDARYSSEVFRFSKPGQVLLLPTDGIMESRAPDETPFGIARTIEFVGVHRQKTAFQIVDGLYKTVKAHAGKQPQLDDITAIIVKTI